MFTGLRDTGTKRNTHAQQRAIFFIVFFFFNVYRRDPLEQTYLVVQNVDKYFLLPVDHKELIEKPGGRLSIGGGMVIKSEEHDIPEETSEQLIEPAEPERPQTDETPQSRTDVPVEMPLQLSQWFEQGSNSSGSGSIPASSAGNKKTSNCCDYCSRVFRRKYELKRHLATHSNTRVECSVCHQFLKTKRTLNLHMKLHEESDKMFECSECDFRSKRMPSMKRHQIRKHSMHANFKCDICSRVFKLNSDLTRHNQLKHLIEPCCCDICGRTYRNMFFLRKHWYLAKKRKKSCDRMRWRGIRSRNVDYATAQKKAESIQVYNCPKCKWRFKNKSLLDRHMQRHLLSFNCETCGAVFKYRASFLKHQEAHKNDQE
ncbi:zinc finger protein 275-like isoform X2 [Frieseomelitta varia]|uniref:zinc finger protein 275-like isoform X2 n=1 Tax=Frieseomelitta varia TaxID=561572 RepID=UPI001CB68373|nr:zinc finger protein 275-like isoform X2 [Frieseomelitta varia]